MSVKRNFYLLQDEEGVINEFEGFKYLFEPEAIKKHEKYHTLWLHPSLIKEIDIEKLNDNESLLLVGDMVRVFRDGYDDSYFRPGAASQNWQIEIPENDEGSGVLVFHDLKNIANDTDFQDEINKLYF